MDQISIRNSLEKRFGKSISFPLLGAHAGSGAFGKDENSIQAIIKALPLHPTGIELDVRKSKDGVLFCRHGSIPLGVLFWQLAPYLRFGTIKKLFPNIDRLDEIMAVLPRSIALVSLDLKDTRITAEEIRPYLQKFQIAVLAYDIDFLKSMRRDLGEKVFYVLAPKLFLKPLLPRAESIADAIVVFPWQYNTQTVSEAAGHGVILQLLQWPVRRNQYIRLVRELGSPWIMCSYDQLLAMSRITSSGE